MDRYLGAVAWECAYVFTLVKRIMKLSLHLPIPNDRSIRQTTGADRPFNLLTWLFVGQRKSFNFLFWWTAYWMLFFCNEGHLVVSKGCPQHSKCCWRLALSVVSKNHRDCDSHRTCIDCNCVALACNRLHLRGVNLHLVIPVGCSVKLQVNSKLIIKNIVFHQIVR